MNSFTHGCRFMLTRLVGQMSMEVEWNEIKSSRVTADFSVDTATDTAEFAVEEFMTVMTPRTDWESFDDAVESVREDYANWLNNTLTVSERWQEARELAAYITWSCVVPAEGCLTRPAMYMSKNWMTNIWSWDNCFNAMALVRHQPELAWDQFMIFLTGRMRAA